jgi:hypothetical protein
MTLKIEMNKVFHLNSFLSITSNLDNKFEGLLIIFELIFETTLANPVERILLYSKRATLSFGITYCSLVFLLTNKFLNLS